VDGAAPWYRYALAVLGVVMLSLAMFTIREELGVLNVTLLFLILSFVLGLALGSGPATVGALLAFLAFDFIFIPPYYTFTVADPVAGSLIAMLPMLVIFLMAQRYFVRGIATTGFGGR